VPRDESLIAAHVAYLRALDHQGLLVGAGPLADGSGGLVVLRAASREEACSLAAQDPFVARGARTADVVEWTISCEANGHLGVARD
jgi:uncharacterized protein YciI